MKHRPSRTNCVLTEGDIGSLTDPQAHFLDRAFRVAHGLPRGPLGILTRDHRVRIEPRSHGAPAA
jgi:hypothetical protein